MLNKKELKLIYNLLDKEIDKKKITLSEKKLISLRGNISELLIEYPSEGYPEPWFRK